MSRQLWHFNGGLKLAGHKKISNTTPITAMGVVGELVIPLQQHLGQPAIPVVTVGEQVAKGQLIAKTESLLSAAVHAPTSGTIHAIELRQVPHPSALPETCIILHSDGEERWQRMEPMEDYHLVAPADIRHRVRDAGIVGLGGAGFPSFIKLNRTGRTATKALIINAAECEPYISCDDRLMRDRAHEVISGIRIIRHAVHAIRTVIGIEDNKPEAFAALIHALEASGMNDIEVVRIPTIYPTGGERQLIKVLTGMEVPADGYAINIGVVCQNVSTSVAIHRAVVLGEPLISRVVTVTGERIQRPQNIEVLIGTPTQAVIDFAGGFTAGGPVNIIHGGPMMGSAIPDSSVPLIKTSNCLLLQDPPTQLQHAACIRCGACAEVCPVELQPQQLYWHARAESLEKLADHHLQQCIECGCCSWVCPSQIPLVHYFRYAKELLNRYTLQQQSADKARTRHELRTQRLERDKQERAAKMKQKRTAISGGDSASSKESKQAAIQAALERAKAKKAATQQPTPTPPPATGDPSA